eukprot:NODE_7444_length_1577_cov_20.900690.p1 GENE.NODE_7444_length_1577_cov_20.900690~~NODE_7444_length_1577_cov_20.900690.p1  ORF type:complete len:277 (+),score=57.18 NODE_7444_length_1577_cov_20.900690:99-929(+)
MAVNHTTKPAGGCTVSSEQQMAIEVCYLSGEPLTELFITPGEPFVAQHFQAVLAAIHNNSPKPVASVHLLLGARRIEEGDVISDLCEEERCVLIAIASPPMWLSAPLGTNARIDEDDVNVLRRQPGCYDKALAIATPARSFEIRVLDSCCNWAGFLEFGFCDGVPETMPQDVTTLPKSWVSGNASTLYIDGLPQEEYYEWKSVWHDAFMLDGAEEAELLVAGDIVSCAVTDHGSMRIEVNGIVVADWDVEIPDSADLHPVVNLYGRTVAVELLSAV